MFQSLGITADQVYTDVYTAWLRDTHEKKGEDALTLFRSVVESGFLDRQLVLPRQRLGLNTINSLSTLLYRSALARLDLHGNTLRDMGVEVLAHLLRDLPSLAYLDIGANDVAGSSMQALGVAVAQHKRLSTLILGSPRSDPYTNRISRSGLSVVLEGCVRSRSLRVLDLGGCVLEGAGSGSSTALAATAGGGGGGGGPSGGGDGGGSAADGADASTSNGNKDGAEVVVAHRPIDLLEQLISSSTTLSSLLLKDTDLTGPGVLKLVHALRINKTLTELDISYNRLPSAVGDAVGALLQARVAMQHPSALRKLYLSGNDLFNTFQRSGLSHFYVARYLQQQQQQQQGGGSTMAGARHTNPHASSTAFYEDGAGDGVDGAPLPSAALLSTLANDRALTHLELDDCGLQGACLALLCRSLMLNQGLLVLSLKNNNIDAEGATLVGRALCRHAGLRKLYLGGNVLEDEGACALAAVLEDKSRPADAGSANNSLSPGGNMSTTVENTKASAVGASTLEVLDLEKTWMGDRGLVALGVALQTNRSLRVLLLDDNHFTHKGCEAFAAFMEKNESVRKCQLGATSASHPILLRIERATLRNARKAKSSESDALQRELARLHYQKYKLQEARVELEALRDKTTDVKHAAENVDLQFKQDTSDYTKKITELKEQIEHCGKQEESYKQQGAHLEEELKKQRMLFEEDMQVVQERLAAEVAQREQMEERFKRCEAELAHWQNEGPAREAERRERLAVLKQDMAQWAEQRQACRAETDGLQAAVQALEQQVDAKKKVALPSPTKNGTNKSRKASMVSASGLSGKATPAKKKAAK